MIRIIVIRMQTVLVVILFLGSLTVLLYNLMTTLALPQREFEARSQLQSASYDLAHEARSLAEDLEGKLDPDRDEVDQKLRVISQRVLREYPGVEGGFYVGLDERFSGYGYPTSKHAEIDPSRNEPPPLESPLIRRQAQQTLDSGDTAMRTEDIETSRVVVITEHVGDFNTNMTTWLMVRLTGPELLERQLRRSEISSFLALGGVGLSLVLTWNLGRVLKRQRREEQRLRDQLRHTEHLAGLGRLLAGVAHEVRNPLAAIRSTVQLWERLPDEARTQESLDAVVRSVDRLAEIVSRLLLFSRADNAERKPVDLNHLLMESLDLVKAQADERGIQLQPEFSNRLQRVLGSANALRQVLLNLITNALQAMPLGGVLRCQTAMLPLNKENIELVISDTGPGISSENRRHIFEPFFTTRPDGTGLGLALCREIVTNHGGTIEYLSLEHGATFRILLPIATE
jgi:two-component system, NtrC family, sensor histidine kinase HydH